MIVLRHSDPINGLGIQEIALTSTLELLVYRLIRLATHFTEVAVSIFFFISGFLYFGNFENWNDYVGKIKKRIGSIVIPYFIWSFLNWLYFAIITHVPLISTKMNMKPVKLDVVNIVHDVVMSSYAPLWFLRVLFALCLLGCALNILLRYRNLAVVFTLILVLWNVFKGYGYQSIAAWLPFFMWGGYLRKYGSKIKYKKAMFIVAIILLLCSYVLDENTVGRVLYIARLLIAISSFSIFTTRNPTEKWFWGTSMFIYCTHFSIVSAIEKLMFVVLGKNVMIGLLAYISVPIVTIFALSYVAEFTSTKLPNVWRVIAGNRSLMIKNG